MPRSNTNSALGTVHSPLSTPTVLGIRHHGPGSARLLCAALAQLRPDAVLIEGPPEGDALLPLAAHKAMKPPVALLLYEPDEPSKAAYYPFALFSPEWQAIQWALASKVPVRFIDLPMGMRPEEVPSAAPPSRVPSGTPSDQDVGFTGSTPPDADSALGTGHSPLSPPPPDPLDALALTAGYEDGEAWWNHLIEERRGSPATHAEDPMSVFGAIRAAMDDARAARDATPNTNSALGPRHSPLELAREAHMRRAVRAAIQEGHRNIAVVCGAWHAPVLTAEALDAHPAKGDDAILKPLKPRKASATWIPWTHDRLGVHSGYGAGVRSPGWYEHLWIHHDSLSERWLTRVARLMRDEGLDASPASIIESVRLADSLASLRGRPIAGLEELTESTLSILCHGNAAPLRVIERKLIVGDQLGQIPDEAPALPLQRDLAAQQKTLRMKVSGDEAVLDLDQRQPNDLARSRLLHRLCILGIPWGTLQDNQRQGTSTFHEIWTLQWKPELAVSVVEAARFGNTIEEAAANRVRDRAEHASDLKELTELLDHVLLAELPRGAARVLERIATLSAVASDVTHLMEALPALARTLRYGNVRKTDVALVEPLVVALLARICAGLTPACATLDDDAAGLMRTRVNAVHAALATLDRADLLEPWHAELERLGDSGAHGLVAGRAWRILLDADAERFDAVASRVSLAHSPGNDPAKASAWLDGFLAGSGSVLVHDERLLGIIDAWACSLSGDVFERICPIARRTFSTFEAPERRMIGERLKRGPIAVDAAHAGAVASSMAASDYDPERGALVDPVLKLILGEDLP